MWFLRIDGHVFSVYLKVDSGYGRAGVPVDLTGAELCEALVKSSAVRLAGIYLHSGHSYSQTGSGVVGTAEEECLRGQQYVYLIK